MELLTQVKAYSSLKLLIYVLRMVTCCIRSCLSVTVTTGKLQVHTVSHKVDLKSNCHAKTFFAATTLVFVAALISAWLNWETFVRAAKFTE